MGRTASTENATLCGDRARRVREMQARVRFVRRAQPPAEIVRVECAKCRQECDLSGVRATHCGDRARRVRETQARARFVKLPRNPLRRSCVSSALNAGESAICPMPAQPAAEIVRVERAKCRRERDLSHARATLCGDRACRVREMQARGDLTGVRATLCGDRACRVHETQARVRLVRACRLREMQARVRLVRSARNPLRRSRASSAQNAGEPAQPSAEIARVERAQFRRERDWCGPCATLCGDRACRARETQALATF